MCILSPVVLTVVFSILRASTVVSLTKQPDPSWLYMWATTEVALSQLLQANCFSRVSDADEKPHFLQSWSLAWASSASLFLQQDIRSEPPIDFNLSASRNRFLQGSNSGRNRIEDTQDSLGTLTGTELYKAHIHAPVGSGPNTADSKSGGSTEFVGLQRAQLKQEVDLVSKSV